jgi:hypothetical protein
MLHVACGDCGNWDIVGPGHPAVRLNPVTGQHEFHDRSALTLNHGDGCSNTDHRGPLHFTFMAGIQAGG